jgi:hypothetical protein
MINNFFAKLTISALVCTFHNLEGAKGSPIRNTRNTGDGDCTVSFMAFISEQVTALIEK